MTARALLALLLVAGVPVGAGAQVLDRPERPGATTRPSSSWRRLTLSVNTLGSYDDNLTAEQGAVDPTQPQTAGYTGFADGALRFDYTGGAQSFGAGGRAYINTFHNIGPTSVYGGDIHANFSSAIGRRHRVEIQQDVRDEPFYGIGGYSGLRHDVEPQALPDANPLSGSYPRRSRSSATAVNVASQWSPRDSLGGALVYDRRSFRDHVGDTQTASAAASYGRNIRRRSSLRLSYNYVHTEFLDTTGVIPSEGHTIDAGINLQRLFSSTRRLTVSFGGGAIRLQTIDTIAREQFEVTAPSAFGGLQFDWARTWSVAADYRRSVGPLYGVSPQPFTTGAGLIRVGGFAARRTDVSFVAAYSAGLSTGLQRGSFDNYSGTSQLRFVLSRDWSALVSHSYYRYELQQVDTVVPGLPTHQNRNAIRVGLSLNLPVLDTRPGLPRRERN